MLAWVGQHTVNNAAAFQQEGSAANPKGCRPTEPFSATDNGNPPASAVLSILQWRQYKHSELFTMNNNLQAHTLTTYKDTYAMTFDYLHARIND